VTRFQVLAGAVWVTLAFAGCTTATTPGSPVDSQRGGVGSLAANSESHQDQDRLARLWQQRSTESLKSDYPLGPGDMLEISVPDIDELKHCDFRVGGNGTAVLPTIGKLQIGGLTEQEVQTEIRQRLDKYLVNPQFNLMVRRYRSRQVAVAGAVTKPGLYELKTTNDTILDVLDQAGGPGKDAAQNVLLMPAEGASPLDRPKSGARSQPVSDLEETLSRGDVGSLMRENDPIVINLRALDRGDSRAYLSLPARPGDVIFVPEAGEVMVQGWVSKPGNYKITPGLTVQGAVAAAGGPMFAADAGSTRLIRITKSGEKLTTVVNVEDANMPVREGDVIDVPYSTAKVVPYGVASLIEHVGIGLPMF
jgi:polysaccharide biosynthesis/export protein